MYTTVFAAFSSPQYLPRFSCCWLASGWLVFQCSLITLDSSFPFSKVGGFVTSVISFIPDYWGLQNFSIGKI